MADTEKKERTALPTFNNVDEARAMPAPERGSGYIDYPHASVPRFKVRVHPPDSSGNVLRQWAIRAKYQQAGKATEVRIAFARVPENPKDLQGLPYAKALQEALKRLGEIDARKALPAGERVSTRMTVADAWARHGVETRLQRDATTEKEKGLYRRYLEHLGNRLLDELDYGSFWSHYVSDLAKGKLLNADGVTRQKLRDKGFAEATLIGVVNLAAKLYTFAHASDGLRGRPGDWNPAQEARRLVGAPNRRTTYVLLNKLAAAWRAADALCAPWARDQFRLYVLTGLRHRLMADLKFSQVDVTRRVLRISPHSPGTKRRGARTSAIVEDILLPLSATALEIILARRPWAPDSDGYVWYTTTTPGGRGVGEQGAVRHSDPRSNWVHIGERVLDGKEVSRHDMRRTFANVAVAAGADLMGTSLLMLHSPRTVARVLSLPEVTMDYINTAEARGRMRAASDAIERYIKGLLDGSIQPPDDEQELPPELAEAVGRDEA